MVTQDSSRNRGLKDGDGWQTDNTWLTDGSTGFLYQVPRIIPLIMTYGFPDSSVGKKIHLQCRRTWDSDSIPGSGRSPGEGIGYPLRYSWASLVAQLVKNPLAMRETWV